MDINFEFIRQSCNIPKKITDEFIHSKAIEFSSSDHNKSPELFKNFLSGNSNHRVRTRYGVNCYCPEGQFKSYASTLKAGHIYAMMMAPHECVNCQAMSFVFSNFIHGLVPAKSGGLVGENIKALEQLIKRENRKALQKNKEA